MEFRRASKPADIDHQATDGDADTDHEQHDRQIEQVDALADAHEEQSGQRANEAGDVVGIVMSAGFAAPMAAR